MYFFEQIKTQFILNLRVDFEVQGAQNPEQIAKTPSEKSDKITTPENTLEHAKKTSSKLDAQINQEKERWLIKDWELAYWNISSKNIETNWFDMRTDNLSESMPAPIGQTEWDVFSLWERYSSPQEQVMLGKLAEGTIGFDDPEVSALAKDLWMEEVLRTAGIDWLGKTEVPEWIEQSTPEMLQWSKTEVESEIAKIDSQIQSLPEGSQERQALEKQSTFLWNFAQAIIDMIEWKQPGSQAWWFEWIDVVWDKDVLARGMTYTGIHENSGEADKFLMWMAKSARQTPWCAWYVSYVLKEAWYNITPTLSSQAFIWKTGKWHVAFYAWNNQMLGWNQSDSVSLAPIRKPIAGWTMPEDLEKWKASNKGWTPPIWAIIVFNRWNTDRNLA